MSAHLDVIGFLAMIASSLFFGVWVNARAERARTRIPERWQR